MFYHADQEENFVESSSPQLELLLFHTGMLFLIPGPSPYPTCPETRHRTTVKANSSIYKHWSTSVIIGEIGRRGGMKKRRTSNQRKTREKELQKKKIEEPNCRLLPPSVFNVIIATMIMARLSLSDRPDNR